MCKHTQGLQQRYEYRERKSHPRAPASPEEGDITYSAALTHTCEEEAPWLCRAPAVGAAAQIPFICPQLLWVLDNYPFILRLCPWSAGGHSWKCLPGYSALLISDPQSISDGSYTVQKAAPASRKEHPDITHTLSSSWNQRGETLQLNSHFACFFLFSDFSFLWSWIERVPQSVHS